MVSSTSPALDAANALPVGHRLHEFELRGVIGVGGFGIVYRAFDHSLQREVAIKEYMPAALAGRSGKHQVSLLSSSHAETFALGLSSFVNEARLLARFDHASLVKVHRFWEEHGTAYMVMPLYRGRTLRELRQSMQRTPDDAWLRRLLEQLLGALEVMHREGVYHRDIAPDNILVADDSPPVLLDFGAARRVISDRSQTLTAILKPSYAPIEQYAESTGLRQGPWTDFYALGATLHFLVTGKPPLPATARAVSDDQPRLGGSGQGGLSDELLLVCDWMIAPRPGDRPRNASEVRAALAGRLPIPLRDTPASETSWQNTVVQPAAAEPLPDVPLPTQTEPRTSPSRGVAWRWAGLGATIAVVGAVGIVWMLRGDHRDQRAASPRSSPAVIPLVSVAPPAAQAAPTNAAPAVSVAEAPREASAPMGEPKMGSATVQAVNPVPAHGRAPPPRQVDATQAPPRRVAGAAHAAPRTPPSQLDEVAAAVAVAPASPAPPPPVSVTSSGSPRDQCSGRYLIALHRCMVRECEKAAFQDHPQCQKVRAIEERTRRTVNAS